VFPFSFSTFFETTPGSVVSVFGVACANALMISFLFLLLLAPTPVQPFVFSLFLTLVQEQLSAFVPFFFVLPCAKFKPWIPFSSFPPAIGKNHFPYFHRMWYSPSFFHACERPCPTLAERGHPLFSACFFFPAGTKLRFFFFIMFEGFPL